MTPPISGRQGFLVIDEFAFSRAPIRLDYRALPGLRGPVVLYRPDQSNTCPSCGGLAWNVGRHSTECARCSTALPLISPAPTGFPTEGQD